MKKELDKFESIQEAFLNVASSHPETIAYSQRQSDGSWVSTTNRELKAKVLALAHWLIESGVKPQDRVAIVSNTRPEWLISDLAILTAGAVVVSVYPSLNIKETGYILYDSGAEHVIIENDEQFAKIKALSDSPLEIPTVEDRPGKEASLGFKSIISMEALQTTTDHHQFSFTLNSFHECLQVALPNNFVPPKVQRDAIASLVYTSGTTGAPKGVIQTHSNHLANVRQAFQAGIVDDENSLMLFLPLAHSFARLMGYIGVLSGVHLKLPAVKDKTSSKIDLHSLGADIRSAGANILPVVPRLLEKMQAGILEKTHSSSLVGILLRLSVWSALKSYRGAKGSRVGFAGLVYSMSSAVRDKIRELLFGKDFHYCIVGGAKLPESVARFFDAIDIEVLEGYGLTETCVATNVNRPGAKRIGTVGPVLSNDIEVRIAEDGEILFKGPNITSGYWNRPAATKEAWPDGWFHTGDLGSLDKDGYLSIVGRKKEIIVTSGGKKITPHEIEDALKQSRIIEEAIVVGEGRKYCVVLIYPSAQASLDNLQSQLGKELDRVNSSLSKFESIKAFGILSEAPSIENGLLTPTMKIKRGEIEKRYKDLIDSLYEPAS